VNALLETDAIHASPLVFDPTTTHLVALMHASALGCSPLTPASKCHDEPKFFECATTKVEPTSIKASQFD
jgi:hypothetical protein